MNGIMKKSYLLAAGMVVAAGFQSCVSEAPFESDVEGSLHLSASISADLTRGDDSGNELSDKCVVYISSEKGLIRKYIGLSNLPESITLKTGSYVAEAWTGDSVSASFDKKFFRGYQPFDISAGENDVKVACKIANVVVSVDPQSLEAGLSDLKITVSNSRAGLEFTKDNIDDKGYYMMPSYDTDLTYCVEGVDISGKTIKKEGRIENVKRAYEYALRLKSGDWDPIYGGAYFKIEIEEYPVYEDVVEIFGRPSVIGVDFDIEKQQVATPGTFTDRTVYVRGYKGIEQLRLKPVGNAAAVAPFFTEVGLTSCDAATREALRAKGVSWTLKSETESDGVLRDEYYVIFSKAFLDALPDSESEYSFELQAIDGQGKETTALLRIVNNLAAVETKELIVMDDLSKGEDMLAVGSRKAQISVRIDDSAVSPVLQYRKVGASAWTDVKISSGESTRGASAYLVTLSGLEPSTSYEYRAVDGDFATETYSFKTEGIFSIPNSSMEEWSAFSDNSKVLLPGAGGVRTFWDSGNHGSATMSVTLTTNSSDMIHSGEYAARLRSQFVGIGVIGKFAAGNLFAGEYAETKGTNGVINFGRPYDGSHPSALTLWANYRPGTVLKGNGNGVLTNGNPDHAQIYVAFTTGPVRVDTSDTSTLFNPEAENVLGYGEVTWTSSFGADGVLEKVTIPVKWYDRAKSTAPTHIVIVCSASKYGDYFTGCEGSLMYVDDFELVY